MINLQGKGHWFEMQNQKKQLNEKRLNISNSMFLVLIIMYTIAFNSSWRAVSWIWYGISIVTIFMLAYRVLQKGVIKLNFYTGWALSFFVYSLFGCLWALDITPVLGQIKTLGLIFSVHILLAQMINTKEDVERLLKAIFIALIIFLFYILFKTDKTMLGKFRIGIDTLGSNWNANDVGMKLCIGFSLSLYFMLSDKSKILQKIFYLLCAMFFMIIALFTGSRKAVFMLAIIFFLLFWFRAKKNRALVFLILALVGIVFIILTMRIPALYDVLGSRMESLFKELMGYTTSEGSFDTRANMIKLGLEWFGERPIFGYGLNNFRVLYSEIGRATYSHNNFIEMLISGGIVGFVIYYSAYVYLFTKLIKFAFTKRDSIAIILSVICIALLILQVAMVSYYSTADNVLIMLGIIYAKIRSEKNENS